MESKTRAASLEFAVSAFRCSNGADYKSHMHIFPFFCFQVARHVANASSISFNQTSPAAIAVYSHVRHQPTPSTPDSQTSNIVHSARNEILRTIELMIEKNQQDVVHLIVEVNSFHCLLLL